MTHSAPVAMEVEEKPAQVPQGLHVFAYVGVDDDKADNKLPVLDEYEAHSLVTFAGDEEAEWEKSLRLRPEERRGWWSHYLEPAGRAGIALVHGGVCDHRATTSIVSLALARRLGLELSFDERLKV
jgi:hypothetical protein